MLAQAEAGLEELWEKIAADWPGTTELFGSVLSLGVLAVLRPFQPDADNNRYRRRVETGRSAP
jgi:hypothetical protein